MFSVSNILVTLPGVNDSISPLGELFDAWFNPSLTHIERARSVFRAKMFLQFWCDSITRKSQHPVYGHFFPTSRSFISSQNYKSLHRLCDAMIKLLIVHRRFYPEVPFLPWQHGSLSLEKLFGIARSFIPNFTYVEFLVMLRHVLARESALLQLAKIGIHQRQEKTSGYVYDTSSEQLSREDQKRLSTFPSDSELKVAADVAWDEMTEILTTVCHFHSLFGFVLMLDLDRFLVLPPTNYLLSLFDFRHH